MSRSFAAHRSKQENAPTSTSIPRARLRARALTAAYLPRPLCICRIWAYVSQFREILQTGPRPDDELIKSTGLDQLDANRLQELQAVLQGLQDLKKRQQEG